AGVLHAHPMGTSLHRGQWGHRGADLSRGPFHLHPDRAGWVRGAAARRRGSAAARCEGARRSAPAGYHGPGGATPRPAHRRTFAHRDRVVQLPGHRGVLACVHRNGVEGHQGRRSDRLPAPWWPDRLRGPQTAPRGGQRPRERGRPRLPHRGDPGARRGRADGPAQRRGHGRRLRHGGHGRLGRPGPYRPGQDRGSRPFRSRGTTRGPGRSHGSTLPTRTGARGTTRTERTRLKKRAGHALKDGAAQSRWARRPGRNRGRSHQVTTIKTAVPGVFYRRPSPEEPPYVQEGDTIQPGQTIALVEVMKNFNEVKADQAGTVTRFLVEDGDEVSISQDIAELGN